MFLSFFSLKLTGGGGGGGAGSRGKLGYLSGGHDLYKELLGGLKSAAKTPVSQISLKSAKGNWNKRAVQCPNVLSIINNLQRVQKSNNWGHFSQQVSLGNHSNIKCMEIFTQVIQFAFKRKCFSLFFLSQTNWKPKAKYKTKTKK